jgi:hypothetical protein
MNRKIINWLLLVFCLTAVSVAQAQQVVSTSRVGYVSTVGSPDANFEELRRGLRGLVTSRARTSYLSIVVLKAKPS